MSKARFTIELTADDARHIRRSLKSIVAEIRKLDIDVDAETIAARMVTAVNAGERDYTRLLALAVGPEGAREWRAN